MRAIDADELCKSLARAKVDSREAILKIVNDAETLNVKPVVEGNWLERNGKFRCSKCGWEQKTVLYDFCPKCGASLIKGEKTFEVGYEYVHRNNEEKYVVIRVEKTFDIKGSLRKMHDGDIRAFAIYGEGKMVTLQNPQNYMKTGRYFSEVEQLIQKINEE